MDVKWIQTAGLISFELLGASEIDLQGHFHPISAANAGNIQVNTMVVKVAASVGRDSEAPEAQSLECRETVIWSGAMLPSMLVKMVADCESPELTAHNADDSRCDQMLRCHPGQNVDDRLS